MQLPSSPVETARATDDGRHHHSQHRSSKREARLLGGEWSAWRLVIRAEAQDIEQEVLALAPPSVLPLEDHEILVKVEAMLQDPSDWKCEISSSF